MPNNLKYDFEVMINHWSKAFDNFLKMPVDPRFEGMNEDTLCAKWYIFDAFSFAHGLMTTSGRIYF